MTVFARIVVGVDGTDWGFEALRQALLLAPKENPILHAVTALDTAPAIHTGMHAPHFAELLANEGQKLVRRTICGRGLERAVVLASRSSSPA